MMKSCPCVNAFSIDLPLSVKAPDVAPATRLGRLAALGNVLLRLLACGIPIPSDKMVLKKLYEATQGTDWQRHDQWNTAFRPMDVWCEAVPNRRGQGTLTRVSRTTVQ